MSNVDQDLDRRAGYDLADRVKRYMAAEDYVYNAYANGFAYDSLGRLVADSLLQYPWSNSYCSNPASVDEDGDQCATDGSWTLQSVTSFQYDAFGNRTDLGGRTRRAIASARLTAARTPPIHWPTATSCGVSAEAAPVIRFASTGPRRRD